MKCTWYEIIKGKLKSWFKKERTLCKKFEKKLQKWLFERWLDVASACTAMRKSPSVKLWLIVGKKALTLLAEATLTEVIFRFLKMVVKALVTAFLKMF